MAILLRQAKVIDVNSSFNGQIVDILIRNGKINAIAAQLPADDHAEEIKGEGLMISPGWVDVLADYREPGYEQKETIASGLRAAAAGGFTDVLLAPNTNPRTDNSSAVKAIRQRSAGNAVTLHPLGAVSREIAGKSLAEMLDMRESGAIAFTDGWQPVQNSNLLLKALEYIKAFDGVILQIPVDMSLAAGGLMNEGDISTRLGMPGIPALAETLQIHRDIELTRYTGSRLHITGVSTAEGIALIRTAKTDGIKITCSVTPYHLALNETALTSYNSLYKVTPPLRSEADRQALIAGLKDGTIDCIASHHRPQDWDAKSREFEYAGEGMNIQELSFPILWNAVSEEISIERLAEALSITPRKIFNLPVTGIEEGTEASFTIFTTEGSIIYRQEQLKSAGLNNPFLGKELKGSVLGIINHSIISLNTK